MVYFSAPQSYSDEYPMPHLCNLPWKVRTLLSEHRKLRGRSKPCGHPGMVCLSDILYKKLSSFTASAHVYFQLAIISMLVLVRFIAVFNERFLDFNRFLTAS